VTRRIDDPAADARRRRALGWGLECPLIAPGADIGRDLVLRENADGTRGLGLVEGIDNLAQGLQIALTTALGSDVFNVEFGFDGLRALVEETDPRLTRERLRVSAVQVLRRDQRVRRIVDLQLSTSRGAAGDVDARRTVTLACAFEAASGDPVTLSINGVIPHG
jgi:phage baseplate assembly protein W